MWLKCDTNDNATSSKFDTLVGVEIHHIINFEHLGTKAIEQHGNYCQNFIKKVENQWVLLAYMG